MKKILVKKIKYFKQKVTSHLKILGQSGLFQG